jgi:hypothetical protein
LEKILNTKFTQVLEKNPNDADLVFNLVLLAETQRYFNAESII